MGEYHSLATIADLRRASLIAPIFVLGSVTPGDGGGGTYVYIQTATPPPDDGTTVIVPSHPREPGYWLRCSSNSGGGSSAKVTPVTAAYQILTTDALLLVDCTRGSYALTLPLANALGNGYGQRLAIKRTDTTVNVLTLALLGSDTIEVAPSIYGRECWEVGADGVSKWWATEMYRP